MRFERETANDPQGIGVRRAAVHLWWFVVALASGCNCGTGLAVQGPANSTRAVDAGRPEVTRYEQCGNGIDDDGNGQIDETCACVIGTTRACASGTAAGVGVCRSGTQSCELSGGELGTATWSPCTGEVGPMPEECNGLDDDCDGVVDELASCALDAGATADGGPADAGSGEHDAGIADAGAVDAGTVPPSYGSCTAPCHGASYVTFNARFNLYVKAVLCSSSRYDLFLGATANGPFFKIGDTAGHGQDHCELVNPNFTLGNEDDVASGSCPSCSVAHAGSISQIPALWGTSMYFRGYLGQPFNFSTALAAGIHTSCWYECGVSFP